MLAVGRVADESGAMKLDGMGGISGMVVMMKRLEDWKKREL